MDRINEFKIEPGVYEGDNKRVVLITIVNEMDENGTSKKLSDPLVCYRPLENVARHLVTGIRLSEFIVKFKEVEIRKVAK